MCTGIAERVTFVSNVRPTLVNKPDFQVRILTATVLTNGCSLALLYCRSDSGIPKYLQGKGVRTHGNAP